MSRSNEPGRNAVSGWHSRWQLPLALLVLSLVALGGLVVWFLVRGGVVGPGPRLDHLAYTSLQEGDVVEQDFQAEHDGLGGFDLVLRPRTTDVSLAFQLDALNENGRSLLISRQVTCRSQATTCRVTFPAIKDSAGKRFAWRVEQNDPGRTDLLITLDGRAIDGALGVNERSTSHDAVFAPVYRSARTLHYFLHDVLSHSLTSSQITNRLGLLTLNSLVAFCLLLLILRPRRSVGLTTFEAIAAITSLPAALLSVALVWAVVLKPGPWVSGLPDEDAPEIALRCLASDACRQRALEALNVAHRVQVDFGERMRLVGYSIDSTSLTPGAALRLMLYWHRLRQMETDYSIFVHLVGEAGEILAQHDSYPTQGTHPTTTWLRDDRVITDLHELVIPESTMPQNCYLRLGVYYWVDLSRLPAVESSTGLLPDAAFQLPQVLTINAP